MPVSSVAAAADVLLLGEQHDAASHQQFHADLVQQLAARGRLGTLAIEMAPRGTDTRHLASTALEADVRVALRWDDRAWPWQAYGPAILAAVRAGVPVVGANLPREGMSFAMRDETIDRTVPASVLAAQQEAVREGHCRRLPEERIAPMTRIQIARDRAMAEVIAEAASRHPGRVVVLMAGAGHVDPKLGVPLHLPRHIDARPVMLDPVPTGKDYCATFR